jgi:hypothetical protein
MQEKAFPTVVGTHIRAMIYGLACVCSFFIMVELARAGS